MVGRSLPGKRPDGARAALDTELVGAFLTRGIEHGAFALTDVRLVTHAVPGLHTGV
jgi:hypothetical protein